ncbi:MAG TPA: helix-turn-helix domain-containing protein [Bacteroidia bacterium]|jgi:AraC-like DNA-binding protein
MSTIPIHDLTETDETSCKVMELNMPSDYATNEAHRHNYYEVLFFIQGSGKHMVDFDVHEIRGRSIHFVAAGQVHALQRSKDTKGYLIAFSKEFMFLNSTDNSILSEFPAFNKSAEPVLIIDKPTCGELEGLVNNMQKLYGSTDPYKDKMLGAYISIFLMKCRSLLTTHEKDKKDAASSQVFRKFNDLLEEKFIELHKVSDYAERMNVSANHLSETIKKITGSTAGELILDRLVLEAKRLLLHSDITAKEVAYHLHYSDPSYFSRFFKTKTGMSPEEFRKHTREKYQH